MTENRKKLMRFHPGSYLVDNLEALNMSTKEFSVRTGIPEEAICDLLEEKGSVTFDIATKLADFFGSSPNLWLNLQNSYDQYMAEIPQQKKTTSL